MENRPRPINNELQMTERGGCKIRGMAQSRERVGAWMEGQEWSSGSKPKEGCSGKLSWYLCGALKKGLALQAL